MLNCQTKVKKRTTLLSYFYVGLNAQPYYIARVNTDIVGSQIVAHTLVETGNGPNRPNTIDL